MNVKSFFEFPVMRGMVKQNNLQDSVIRKGTANRRPSKSCWGLIMNIFKFQNIRSIDRLNSDISRYLHVITT